MAQSSRGANFKLPAIYSLFFLSVEPLSALLGAYYAHFLPHTYLALTDASSAPPSTSSSALPLATSTVLSQLANLYLLFALNEALVLRCSSDLRVWRTLLFGLLVADFGHLYSVRELKGGLSTGGGRVYWDVTSWNAMDWGNVGFVYLGATMRVCFLLGIGMGGRKSDGSRKVK
ncbi:hypothetical protein F5884DRAFT_199539 [Xylogone sp. PMI_703]|nr:hypothetical protein F5884DRAFT_199539 [Xylogone sp. PMI_703]